MVSEPPGRNATELIMASKVLHPEGRALTYRAKAARSVARTDATEQFGGAGRHSTVTVMLSNLRPPPPVEKICGAGKPYNRQHREIADGETDSARCSRDRLRGSCRNDPVKGGAGAQAIVERLRSGVRRLVFTSLISIPAIANAVHRDSVGRLIKRTR
jgi:hypothetical protein